MFNVGDTIKAICNNYTHTSKREEWEGVVTSIDSNTFFTAKTIHSLSIYYKNRTWHDLKPQYFKIIKHMKKANVKKIIKPLNNLKLK